MKPFTLSVVCPAFNEEEVLPQFHRRLTAVLDGLGGACHAEMIYVDDGSRDRTLAVLRGLAAGDERVRYLSLSRNFGHQAALTAGLEAARGEVVVTLDSDLQHPPALIPTLLRHWQEGKDVVITLREGGAGPGWLERLLSRWFYVFIGWVSNTEIRPAAADFRLMSRRAVDALLSLNETHRFLRGMVQWLGFPSAEVSYMPDRRAAGNPKYNFRQRLRLALDGILSFSKAPLRLALLAGVPAVACGLLTSGYALLWRWPVRGEAAAFGPLLFGSLYLMGGCILCGLGLLGEYLGRIYDQVRTRPIYVLKEQGGGAQEDGREGIVRPPARRETRPGTEGGTAAA